MTALSADIASFERMRSKLETDHDHAWVLFRHGQFIGAYADFDCAAAEAMERFDDGPYLLRQVGGPRQVQLTGGMIFTRAHG